MNALAISRIFRAAVVSAIDNRYNDPYTMAAVDLLANEFRDLPTMLDYLWDSEDGPNWGSILGIEYSLKKQNAVLIVTGKSWSDWLSLYQK